MLIALLVWMAVFLAVVGFVVWRRAGDKGTGVEYLVLSVLLASCSVAPF